MNGRKVAKVMRDGTKLCAAFQHGQCKQDHALRASTGAALW